MKPRTSYLYLSKLVLTCCTLLLLCLAACGGGQKPPPDDGDTGEPKAVCTYGDAQYQQGESFPAKDGCNTCTCGKDGMVQCTEMACNSQCDPANEPKRRYIGKSPEECARIRFACEVGTNHFSNECGCGCETP